MLHLFDKRPIQYVLYTMSIRITLREFKSISKHAIHSYLCRLTDKVSQCEVSIKMPIIAVTTFSTQNEVEIIFMIMI